MAQTRAKRLLQNLLQIFSCQPEGMSPNKVGSASAAARYKSPFSCFLASFLVFPFIQFELV